jgi:hypothetical protein
MHGLPEGFAAGATEVGHPRLAGLARDGRRAGEGGGVGGRSKALAVIMAVIAEFRSNPDREPGTCPTQAEEHLAVRMPFKTVLDPEFRSSWACRQMSGSLG